MLFFSWLLHFYQPPTQFPQMTKKIAKESYERVLKILQGSKDCHLTVNFSASLTEQLAKLGLGKVIEGFGELARLKRIEFTGSAAYHPLLPKVPKEEIIRQIKLNEEINRKYFGFARRSFSGGGFFSPEMAYSKEVGEVVESLGYKWVILDESAMKMQNAKCKMQNEIYRKKNSNLAVFFRNRELSLKIAFSGITGVRQLFQFFDREGYSLDNDGYIIVALDGETFGHHQPEQLKFLEELFAIPTPSITTVLKNVGKTIKFVTISELLDLFPLGREIEPKTSSWGESWKRWDNPKNPIHRLQWRLHRLALRIGSHTSSSRIYLEDGLDNPRSLLDRALHSDQFWWASHSPCWHPKMIERGARMLRNVVLLSSRAGEREKKEARKLYNEIILTGRRLYGDEIIPC